MLKGIRQEIIKRCIDRREDDRRPIMIALYALPDLSIIILI